MRQKETKKQNLGSLFRLQKILLMSQSWSLSTPYCLRKITYVQVTQHTPCRNYDLGFSCRASIFRQWSLESSFWKRILIPLRSIGMSIPPSSGFLQHHIMQKTANYKFSIVQYYIMEINATYRFPFLTMKHENYEFYMLMHLPSHFPLQIFSTFSQIY